MLRSGCLCIEAKQSFPWESKLKGEITKKLGPNCDRGNLLLLAHHVDAIAQAFNGADA